MSYKVRRYSRKREAIVKLLMSTDSHPTAEWIYSRLKPDIPDLSLATVYRNLSELKQNGEIQGVAFFGGKERFDGDAKQHTHFLCDCCGKIDDIDFTEQSQSLNTLAESLCSGKIDYHSLVFHGKCKHCIASQSDA